MFRLTPAHWFLDITNFKLLTFKNIHTFEDFFFGLRPYYQAVGRTQWKKTLDRPAGPIVATRVSEAAHCRIVITKGQRPNGKLTLR